jgi:hypothetical protein
MSFTAKLNPSSGPDRVGGIVKRSMNAPDCSKLVVGMLEM